MLDRLKDHGFIVPDEEGQDVPIGFSVKHENFAGLKYRTLGISCAACHTGKFTFEGRTYLVDGMPNMVDIESWTKEFDEALKKNMTSFPELVNTLKRSLEYLREQDHPEKEKKELKEKSLLDPKLWASIGSIKKNIFREIRVTLNRLEAYKNIIRHVTSSPPSGPGRDDAWAVIDLTVLETVNPRAIFRPVSIPPLYGVGEYDIFHYDGNTNSLMDRNIAQSIALGAFYDSKTNVSEINLANVHKGNILAKKIKGPVWPTEVLGSLDQEKVERGKAIFHEKRYKDYKAWDQKGNRILKGKLVSCADCHSHPQETQGQIFYDVGTSQSRLEHYVGGQEKAFQELAGTLAKIREETRKSQNITRKEADKWERKTPSWNIHKGYLARPLLSIWASPPYLHNGSVPSIRDLLKPTEGDELEAKDRRPEKFYVGNKEYNPSDIGYESQEAGEYFLFDTQFKYNSNKGHSYGTRLDAEEKEDLLEYLKSL